MSTQELEIRLLGKSEKADVFEALARLHAEEISAGFLTSLGQPLLARLYASIVACPEAFTVIGAINGQIVGFLCASLNTKAVYRFVFMRSWFRLISILAWRLSRWSTVVRCWETLRYPSKEPVADLPSAEILNFCVTSRRQRAGIGMALFRSAEAEYHRLGVRRLRIVTGSSQLQAIKFYEKLGAEPVGRFEVHAKTESRLFCYSIRDCQ